MGIYTPVAHKAFADGFLQFLDACQEFARAADAWLSFSSPGALNLVTLERDLDTLRPLCGAVLPNFKELDTVFTLAERQKLQDPEITRQIDLLKGVLGGVSRHAQALSGTKRSKDDLMDLLGMNPEKLSPDVRALREAYFNGWNCAHCIEREFFKLFGKTEKEAFQPGRERVLAIWAGALEKFFCPDFMFRIRDEDKSFIRNTQLRCEQRDDSICDALEEKLIAWREQYDQPATEPPVPTGFTTPT